MWSDVVCVMMIKCGLMMINTMATIIMRMQLLYDFASKGNVERQLHGKGEALLAKVVQLVIMACDRVAEVGRLSANAKNTFCSFVEHVFANSREKTLFLCVIQKLQQKT